MLYGVVVSVVWNCSIILQSVRMPLSESERTVRGDPERQPAGDDEGSGKDEHDSKGKPGKRKLA